MARYWSLTGLTSYEAARELQLKLVELRAQDLIPDTVLFLEHSPVVTRGKGLQFTGEMRPKHMPVPSILPAGVGFAESERGGDLTYHGPGQLVIYPIVKLGGDDLTPERNLAGYLRALEGALIDLLMDAGLPAQPRPSATGVWIGAKKIASIGIAVRKWVTYHGMAVNFTTDLKPFQFISPCGFSPEVMARLSDLIPERVTDDWRAVWELGLARKLGAWAKSIVLESEIVKMTCAEAMAYYEAIPVAEAEEPTGVPASAGFPVLLEDSEAHSESPGSL